MRLLGQFQTFYLFIFYDNILHAQKAQKECKAPKRTKRHKDSFKLFFYYLFFHDKVLQAQKA